MIGVFGCVWWFVLRVAVCFGLGWLCWLVCIRFVWVSGGWVVLRGRDGVVSCLVGLVGCGVGFSCNRYIDGFVDIAIVVGWFCVVYLFLVVSCIVWGLVVGFGWFYVGSWGFVC